MRALIAVPVLTTALLLAGCATPEQHAEQAARAEAKVPPATPVGKPVSCIRTSSIRQSKVRNDQVIDFVMRGGKVYRNRLPNSCPSLGFEERFSHKTSINQFCSTDTITVLYSSPPQQGATCGLGEFQPVKLADDAG